MRKLSHILSLSSIGLGVLTNEDILLILAILIQGLSLLYDYIKNRK